MATRWPGWKRAARIPIRRIRSFTARNASHVISTSTINAPKPGPSQPKKRGTNHKRHNEDHKKAQETSQVLFLCALSASFVPFVYRSPFRRGRRTQGCGSHLESHAD